jgi:predicted site-specific integrase-resolvase
MSLGKTWYTVEEATEKFGVAQEQLLKWVSEGIIRTEKESGQMMLINGDDLALKLQEQAGSLLS